MLRSNSKTLGNHVVSPEDEKERPEWEGFADKKLSYRRGTARCVVSIEILPIATNSAETTYTTSPDQIDGMKVLEV